MPPTVPDAAPAVGGPLLFTFAVVADTHLEPEAAESPRSNRRSRYALRHLMAERPAFVLHLGDLVHPVPALPGFAGAARAVQESMGLLDCPHYLTPGNHDVGDKSVPWMPAKAVTAEWIGTYEQWFGAPYQAFDHGDCRFLLINSPALGSGLPFEAEQQAWLERELASATGKRLFLATHYPPYLLHAAEPSHYDNMEAPARAWFLALLERHGVEALFTGHVHNFFYNRHGVTDCYSLPSPSFVRRDYSELFRVAPGPDEEHGRNDVGRLGYFLVDVYATGHVARTVPTHGALDEPPPDVPHLRTLHPVLAPAGGVGAHLRHPWAEVVALPYNPPTDEFQRRQVRNDHPVAALWQLGLRNVRVPLHELAEAATRARMTHLSHLGQRFTVFSLGAPSAEEAALLREYAHLVAAWEVVLEPEGVADTLRAVAPLRADAGLTVYGAPLLTAGADLGEGPNLRHFTGAGFDAAQRGPVDALLATDGVRDALDGLGFRIPASADPWVALPAATALAREHGLQAAVTVALAPDDPSAAHLDDQAQASRVAVTLLAAGTLPETQVFLDAFADVDRGYFVRTGLVDRRGDLRLAGHVYRHTQAALAGLPAGAIRVREPLPGGVLAHGVRAGETALALLLPPAEGAAPITALPADLLPPDEAPLQVLRLDIGTLHRVSWTLVGEGARLDQALTLDAPLLVGGGPAAAWA